VEGKCINSITRIQEYGFLELYYQWCIDFFKESGDEAVGYFWNKIAEEKLSYKRKGRLRRYPTVKNKRP
jgi:hypothetical protein